MRELYAQGDILIERVADVVPTKAVQTAKADEPVVVAEGEATGHRHLFLDGVAMFRDDGLARDVPGNLYVGHLVVEPGGAQMLHNEHAPVKLTEGTYRVRRQREVEPQDVGIVAD